MEPFLVPPGLIFETRTTAKKQYPRGSNYRRSRSHLRSSLRPRSYSRETHREQALKNKPPRARREGPKNCGAITNSVHANTNGIGHEHILPHSAQGQAEWSSYYSNSTLA